MRDQVNYYLDRAQMAARAGTIGRVTEVGLSPPRCGGPLSASIATKLSIIVQCASGVRFQGEKQDLEEMLGNLADNACKWANSTVYITADVLIAAERSARRR